MQIEATKTAHPLEKGQTWRLGHCYLHILSLGKRLVQYQILKQVNEHAANSRLIGLVELLMFLKHNEAELMNEESLVLAGAN
jgi:hypothetical protein